MPGEINARANEHAQDVETFGINTKTRFDSDESHYPG
jgi:hypothetical protein